MQPSGVQDDGSVEPEAVVIPKTAQHEPDGPSQATEDPPGPPDEGTTKASGISTERANANESERDSSTHQLSEDKEDKEVFKSIAKDDKSAGGSNSPSESTGSGLVSPSTCSVSSQESHRAKQHAEEDDKTTESPPAGPKTSKKEARASSSPSPSQGPSQGPSISSDLSTQIPKTNVPLHTTSSTFAKPPPRAGASKPQATKPKVSTPRPGSRKRSNSVPAYPSSATFSAASAVPLPALSSSPKGGQLRRGKWTVEEETYVSRVIHDFNNGFLDAPAGTTLRTYLSDKLNCDPMRITKKFTGDACIGKRVFHPAVQCPSNAAVVDKAQVCICICI